MDLDRTDRQILARLQKDARLLNKQLSAEVGLAASSCHERVRRLWEAGVIRGTEARVDPKALGYGVTAVVFVRISKQGQLAIDALMDRLIAVPEIQEVRLITGPFDLVVTLIARDMDHLKTIAYGALTDTDQITNYETSIVYDSRRDGSVPTGDQ